MWLNIVLFSRLESIKEIQTWRAHNIGCPVYGMAYRKVSDAEAKKDVPDRLFTSSTEGQIREWDPETGENKNATIITVRIFLSFQQFKIQKLVSICILFV